MTQHRRSNPRRNIPTEADSESMGGCLTRLGWLMIAPVALVALGAVVARNGSGPWSVESVVYWTVVVVAMAVRYVDIFRFRGETMDGAPASREDWRRYRLRFPALALAGWSAALFVGAT